MQVDIAWNKISYLVYSVITKIKSDHKIIDFKLESANSFIQIVKFLPGLYFIDGRSFQVRALNLDRISRSSSL